MAIKCQKCNKTIGRSEDYLLCRKECAANYHITCLGISKKVFEQLKATKQINEWGCGFCSASSINTEVTGSNNSLFHSCILEENTSKLPRLLREVFQDLVESLSQQHTLLIDEIKELKHQNTQLRNEVQQLNKLITDGTFHSKNSNKVPEPPTVPTFAQVTKNKNTVIVKPKDASQANLKKTKADLITKFDPRKCNVGISDVRPTKSGGLLLKCHNPSEFKKVVLESDLTESYEIHDLKTPLPRIRISGLSDDIDKELIIPYLIKQNENIFSSGSVCKLLKHSQTKRKENIFQALIQVDVTSYNNALKAGHCIVGLDSCTIYDAIDVLRCFKCNGFNHSSRTCKKQTSCPRCAGSHDLKQCQSNTLKCINCMGLKDKESLTEENLAHAVWSYDECRCYKNIIQKLKSDMFTDIQL